MIWTEVGSSFFLPPVCCVDIFCVISFFLFFFGLFFHFGAVQTAKTLRSLWKHALFSPLPSVVVHCYTVSACTWPQVADKGESAFFDDGYTEYMTGKRNMAESQLLFWTVEKALLGNGLEFVFFKCWIMVWHNCVCVCVWVIYSLTLMLHTAVLRVCICASLAFHLDCWSTLFLCLTCRINILLPLPDLSASSLAPSSPSQASDYGFIYASPHTAEGLAGILFGWYESGLVLWRNCFCQMAANNHLAICFKPLLTLGRSTESHITFTWFTAIHRGLSHCNQSPPHRVIYWSGGVKGGSLGDSS